MVTNKLEFIIITAGINHREQLPQAYDEVDRDDDGLLKKTGMKYAFIGVWTSAKVLDVQCGNVYKMNMVRRALNGGKKRLTQPITRSRSSTGCWIPSNATSSVYRRQKTARQPPTPRIQPLPTP